MCTWTEMIVGDDVVWETSCGCEMGFDDHEAIRCFEPEFCLWCGEGITERTLDDKGRDGESARIADAESRLDAMREDGVLCGPAAMDALKGVLE